VTMTPPPTSSTTPPADAEPSPSARKRRSGSETRKRGKSILIRLDEAERIEVEEASRRAGMTVGTYARHRMLKGPAPRAVRRPTLERELAAKLLGQMGRVGGNLHQLVRHLNFGRELEERQLAEVLEALVLLKGEILQSLGRTSPAAKEPHQNLPAAEPEQQAA